MLNGGRAAAVVLFLVTGAVMHKAVLCITIDNQLQVLRNDCYERLAIGQRLEEKDVYRSTNSNTVTDCQMDCTHDEDKCKSFSFGIGVKGNASCELSSHVVKETIDLKPIGTLDDTDFDLYIKKLGCKLVIDMQPILPDFANDEPYEPDEISKPKPRPRPGSYSKNHGSFHYGSENHHQSSYNSEGYWSMKKFYKGDRLTDDNDRAVSYNRYEKPQASSYDKPNKYGFAESKPNPYEDIDKISFVYPYEDGDDPNHHKPEDYYNSGSDKRKPQNSAYGDEGNRPSSSSYGNKPSRPSDYESNPKPPYRPTHLNKPYGDDSSHYPHKPSKPLYQDPDNPNSESNRPNSAYAENDDNYTNKKPTRKPPPKYENSGGYQYNKPSNSNGYNYNRPSKFEETNGYHYPKPEKPSYNEATKPVFEMDGDAYEYPKRPSFPGNLYGGARPMKPGYIDDPYDNPHDILPEIYSPKYPYQKPIINDYVDPYGHLVTSVITEIGDVCFRRALAAKRVSRIFVRRAVSCERIEHCQQECAEEKRFNCEGFNYRLDLNGHGRGDCELLDVPYIRLDLRRDIVSDPDYDYYEKDRNCKDQQRPPFRPSSGGEYMPTPPRRPALPDWHSTDYIEYYSSRDRFRDRYDERFNFDRRGSEYPPPNSRPYNNRRGDYFEESYDSRNKYDSHYNSYDYSYHYSPPFSSSGKDYNYKYQDPHLSPPRKYDDRDYWIDKYYVKPYYKDSEKPPYYNSKWGTYGGSYGDFGSGYSSYEYANKDFHKESKYPAPSPPKHWGEYGGTYGTDGYYYQANDYWDLNKISEHKFTSNSIHYNDVPPSPLLPPLNKPRPEYLPTPYEPSTGYIPPTYSANDTRFKYNEGHPREPPQTLFNECSLRSATGYRLYKRIVKKILTVPTIYDCENACFREKDFVCTSYAFRYVVAPDIPPNNCYLSDKSYKALDYYTDLEQDRNFDIYTMSNRERCGDDSPRHRESSECFLHVRSGLRFEDKCVKDSLIVKSIVDCELACLKSVRFICRTFSFRYGSSTIGEVVENCQLTDIPYNELDPRQDFIFNPGFIIYERASFGYGCELKQLPGIHKPEHASSASLSDEICYVGFGWAAKLLLQAVKRVLKVNTESECKAECTRARMETPFCCMTFSYKSIAAEDEANCFLSDIFQRDLLENVDYVRNPDYWLFSWDNTNPHCNFPDYFEQRIPFDEKYDIFPGSLTWKIYSVGGWPCKRGSFCKQSELGFWFCELDGGSPSAWDYCCRPNHQCGYSEGFHYQWCYVGPSSTQWRKCNDKYYPYLPSLRPPEHHTPTYPSKPTFVPHIPSSPQPPDYSNTQPPQVPSTYIPTPTTHVEPPNKGYLPPALNQPKPWITTGKPVLTSLQPPSYRPGFRPDRPPILYPSHKPKPSLNEYEEQFDNLFLDPPKPGGFGQARHWPVSYLHKEMPPNMTTPFEQKFERMEVEETSDTTPRVDAIQNLINVIKTNDLTNIKYHISNASRTADNLLYIQIPLPSKFPENNMKIGGDEKLISKPIDLLPQSSRNVTTIDIIDTNSRDTNRNTAKGKPNVNRSIYRRGFIEKTNVTNYRRSSRFL